MAKSRSKRKPRIYLSIVIPSYNSRKWIDRCLMSLQYQVARDDVEVLVVDSSEDDPTDTILRAYPFVRVIHLEQRAYPGTARTVGIQHARGRVIAFLDTDCKAGEGWVERIIEEHKCGRHVVGGPVANGTPYSSVGTAEYLLEFSELVPAMPEGPVRFIPTCNLSFKRSVFDRIGKLEDTIKGSDALFCRKITQLGEPIYFKHDITVWHANRTALRKVLRNQYEIGFGAAQVRRLEDQVGAVLVKVPGLIPLIPFARTLMIGKRFLKHDRRLFVKFVLLYPLIFLGLLAYTKGFWDGRKQAIARPAPAPQALTEGS